MKPLPAGVLLVAFVAAAYWWHHDGVQQGLDAGRLEGAVARVDTLTRIDTVRAGVSRRLLDSLKRALTHYDTARVTDTLPVVVEVPGRPDTVRIFIPRDVADSAVSMCRRSVLALTASCATKDTLITALRANLRAAEAAKPSFLKRWGDRALAGAVVAGAICLTRGC